MTTELQKLEALVAASPDEYWRDEPSPYRGYRKFREEVIQTYPLPAYMTLAPARDVLILTVDENERFLAYPETDPSNPVHSGGVTTEFVKRMTHAAEHWDVVFSDSLIGLIQNEIQKQSDTEDEAARGRRMFFWELDSIIFSDSIQERYWVHRAFQGHIEGTLEYLKNPEDVRQAFYWVEGHPTFWKPDRHTGYYMNTSTWTVQPAWNHEILGSTVHQLCGYTQAGTRIESRSASYDEAVIEFAHKLHQTCHFDGTERKENNE